MALRASNSNSMYHLRPHSEAMYRYFQNMLQPRDIIQILPKVQTSSAHAICFAFSFRISVDSPFSLQFSSFKLLSPVCLQYNNILLSTFCTTILFAFFFNLSILRIRPETFKKNYLIFVHKTRKFIYREVACLETMISVSPASTMELNLNSAPKSSVQMSVQIIAMLTQIKDLIKCNIGNIRTLKNTSIRVFDQLFMKEGQANRKHYAKKK